jgi:DNA polymerase V
MRTIDLLNKRFNKNAITWAIATKPQSWPMNKNFLSRSSTTDIKQIPTIVK